MGREPDLLITASGSFVDKYKLAYIKKICAPKNSKVKTLFQEITTILRPKIEKSESIVNNKGFTSQKRPKFAHEQISFQTHTRTLYGSHGNAFKNI